MIVVSTNEIPGYRIEAVFGEVMGLTVRSASIAGNFTASFRSIGGGEIPEYTQMVLESRQQVMQRMVQQAVQRGANAVVAMRFDTGDIAGQMTEVCAYGTAVYAVPIPEGEDGWTPQSAQFANAPTDQYGQRPGQQGFQNPPMNQGGQF